MVDPLSLHVNQFYMTSTVKSIQSLIHTKYSVVENIPLAVDECAMECSTHGLSVSSVITLKTNNSTPNWKGWVPWYDQDC